MQKKRILWPGIMGWVLLNILLLPFPGTGKLLFGVLPVSSQPEAISGVNDQQLQLLKMQLQDQLVTELRVVANPIRLSREHILLLMKEIPSPDPEKLSEEAIRIISKKENLAWLLKCTLESLQLQKENARTVIHITILEGNSGKAFWTKKINAAKILSPPIFSEHLLLNELFQPIIDEAVNEIITLSL